MIENFKLILITCLIACLCACSNNEMTEDDEIRQYIETGKMAAENKNHSDLGELIADGYIDDKGFTKTKIVKMIRAYFFMHSNIHLLIKIDDIIFLKENEAFVNLHVAMAGKVIADVNALTSLRARIYKFDLQLIKSEDEEWLLKQAKWKKTQLNNML